MPTLYLTYYVLVTRWPLQMPEFPGMANDPMKKSLPKTLNPFTTLPATLGTITVHANGTHNTLSLYRVTLVPYNAQINDRAHCDKDTQIANHQRDEDRTDKNDAPYWRIPSEAHS